MDREAGAAQRARALDAVFGILIAQHQCGRPDLDLRMTDSPTRLRESKDFRGAESARVELDRFGGAMNAQVRVNLVDLAHLRLRLTAGLDAPDYEGVGSVES